MDSQNKFKMPSHYRLDIWNTVLKIRWLTISPIAVIRVRAKDEFVVAVRCVLVQRVQSFFIAEYLVQKLLLRKKSTTVETSE